MFDIFRKSVHIDCIGIANIERWYEENFQDNTSRVVGTSRNINLSPLFPCEYGEMRRSLLFFN